MNQAENDRRVDYIEFPAADIEETRPQFHLIRRQNSITGSQGLEHQIPDFQPG